MSLNIRKIDGLYQELEEIIQKIRKHYEKYPGASWIDQGDIIPGVKSPPIKEQQEIEKLYKRKKVLDQQIDEIENKRSLL
jgi:ribosomal silencing factor RsfS